MLALLLAGSAQAAGFSCGHATTAVEKRICADNALKAMDDRMSDAYQGTLDAAADQGALVRSQREWLRGRNRCADADCLSQAYRDRMAALDAVPRAEWHTYRNAELGISFEYLGNRQVRPCPGPAVGACVALLSRRAPKGEVLITFEVKDGALEQVAETEAGFDRQDGKWMTTYGPGIPVEVERFAGRGWKGLRATIICGVSDDETGFHAAGGECFWAVLGHGARSVVASTGGLVGTDADTQRSVNSLRFLR